MQTNNPSPSKARRIIGNILLYFAVFVITLGCVLKFAHVPQAVAVMTSLGLTGGKYTLVAVIELLSAILLAFKPLRSFGILFVSAHLGGAICSHLQASQYHEMFPPMLVLTCSWVGTFLLHPEALWSFGQRS